MQKLIVQTKEEDKQNDQRQDISDVSSHPFPDLHAFSGVGFFCEAFPAPATFGNAEKQVYKRAKRKQKVAYQEILEVENRTSEYIKSAPAPYVVTKNAWQRKKDDRDRLIRLDFLRLQPVSSIPQEIIFSNTARMVEKAANDIKMKNRLPHSLPSGMWLKIFGSVMKIRLGPEVWSTLNVKHAGKIISPEVIATNVSRIAMFTDSPSSA